MKCNASRKQSFLLLQKTFGFLYVDGITSSHKPPILIGGILRRYDYGKVPDAEYAIKVSAFLEKAYPKLKNVDRRN